MRQVDLAPIDERKYWFESSYNVSSCLQPFYRSDVISMTLFHQNDFPQVRDIRHVL